MNNKDDILIGLMKKVKPDTPSPGFIASVMEMLEMDVENELKADTMFSDFLNKVEAVDSDDNLTHRILQRIGSQESGLRFPPIIGKRIGLIFVSTMFTLITMSFFVKGETIQEAKRCSLNFLYDWINKSSYNFSILFISIISVCSLLLIDYAVKKTLSKKNLLDP